MRLSSILIILSLFACGSGDEGDWCPTNPPTPGSCSGPEGGNSPDGGNSGVEELNWAGIYYFQHEVLAQDGGPVTIDPSMNVISQAGSSMRLTSQNGDLSVGEHPLINLDNVSISGDVLIIGANVNYLKNSGLKEDATDIELSKGKRWTVYTFQWTNGNLTLQIEIHENEKKDNIDPGIVIVDRLFWGSN